MKTKWIASLMLAACCGIMLCGCKSGSSTPEAAKQKEEAKDNFSKLPPQVRPGGGPGK